MSAPVETLPSPATEGNDDRGQGLAIRWLFPEQAGSVVVSGDGALLLGRDPSCHVVLEGKQVSRKHAELRREGAALFVRDLGSRNGVYVDGMRLGAANGEQARLFPGTLLRVGDFLGIVASGQHAEAPFHAVFSDYVVGPVSRHALLILERAARSSLPVVIAGETGTGKEGAARALHAWSGRKGAFVAVNASAIPEGLAEAELFGYRRGAFTGATQPGLGLLRAASGGTLFLDEIVDLPASLQPKLLRALEQRELVPLGETAPVRVDVRVVVASQSSLAAAVQAGRFRRDLAARLEGVTITLPPLRERVIEVPHLFLHLLRRAAAPTRPPSCDVALVEQLCLHDWPANVRELDLLAQQLIALQGHATMLAPHHLPDHLRQRRPMPKPVPVASVPPLAPSASELERLLREHDGNVRVVARLLGASRQRLYRWVKVAGLKLDELRPPNQS